MNSDPIQMLIDAGAIPSSPFEPNSRYKDTPLAVYLAHPGAPPRVYLSRRFMPRREEIAIAAEHVVRAGERPDTLAALTLGDPLLYWRLADANAVLDPNQLSDRPGARVKLPLPPGMSGPSGT